MEQQAESLKVRLTSGAALAVSFLDGTGVAEFFGSGVKPLLKGIVSAPAIFNNAVCADKVVGKAAALLFVYLNVRFVYAGTLSEPAKEIFEKFKIPYSFGITVPFIKNRDGTGGCPMENLCAGIFDPEEALKVLREKTGI